MAAITFKSGTMMTDSDRCLILLAIQQSEFTAEITPSAYVALLQGQPWAPYRTLQAWAKAHGWWP